MLQNLPYLPLFQETLSTPTTTPDSFSLWKVISSTGTTGLAILGILLLMSIVVVYIVVERHLTISRASKVDSNFMKQIRNHVVSGNVQAAKDLCARNDVPVARMVEKGLQRIGKPIREIEGAIESAGRLEILELERNVGVLGTLAGVAPMLGFLGTIFGVIHIFYNISLANTINIGLVSQGLYEKMVTSAAGLGVGMMAHIAHHYLVLKTDRVMQRMEITAVEFIDLIEEPVAA